MFDPVRELWGRVGVWTPVECDVRENVGVQEHHFRYLSASASYRGSSRCAARNFPRHREEKDGPSCPAISLTDCSIREESDTPRDRTCLLAAGSRSASMAMVSYCFIFSSRPYTHADLLNVYTCIRGVGAVSAGAGWGRIGSHPPGPQGDRWGDGLSGGVGYPFRSPCPGEWSGHRRR